MTERTTIILLNFTGWVNNFIVDFVLISSLYRFAFKFCTQYYVRFKNLEKKLNFLSFTVPKFENPMQLVIIVLKLT